MLSEAGNKEINMLPQTAVMPWNDQQQASNRALTADIGPRAKAGNTFKKCAQNMPRTRKCLLWQLTCPAPLGPNNCRPEPK